MYRLATGSADPTLLDEGYMDTWTDAARGRGLSNAGLTEALEIVKRYF